MKSSIIQHEIILVTNTSYYQRELMEKNEDPGNSVLSQAEKLEKACWNGLIDHVLSGIVEDELFPHNLTVRHTRAARAILKIELASYPVTLEKCHSIDSVFYLTTVSEN